MSPLAPSPTATHAPADMEPVACLACGSEQRAHFIDAQDDLTGKPGTWTFVRCVDCGLVYQHPRIPQERIGAYYDDDYVSHRKEMDWGPFGRLAMWAMGRHDRAKVRLVQRFARLGPGSQVLDVGCAAGTFLARLGEATGASLCGVDFKDLSAHPDMARVEHHVGEFRRVDLEPARFDLITLWHFLEHDYDPAAVLERVRELLKPGGRIVIEVPRLDSLTFKLYRERWPGLQAPQHTVLFDKQRLLDMVRAADLQLEAYLPYGAFPAYFYVFCGAAFKVLKGRGLNLNRAVLPYFAGELALSPALLFERYLNLAMQTVVLRRP